MLTIFHRFVRQHSWLAAMLCVCLLLFGTTIQATHSHLPGESAADCSLCVTAHAAVQILIFPVGLVAPAALVERIPSQRPLLLKHLVLAHPLWSRPPPTSRFAA